MPSCEVSLGFPRLYWHTAVLGPRFLATAFAAGPALMIVILAVIRRNTLYQVRDVTLAPPHCRR